MIVKKLVKMILLQLCLRDKYFCFPRLFEILSFIYFLQIGMGFITAFMQFIMLFIELLLAIFRIYQFAIPQSVYYLLNIDAINISYLGLRILY